MVLYLSSLMQHFSFLASLVFVLGLLAWCQGRVDEFQYSFLAELGPLLPPDESLCWQLSSHLAWCAGAICTEAFCPYMVNKLEFYSAGPILQISIDIILWVVQMKYALSVYDQLLLLSFSWKLQGRYQQESMIFLPNLMLPMWCYREKHKI